MYTHESEVFMNLEMDRKKPKLEVITIVVGSLEENCYLIIKDNKEAIVIDPGDEPNKIIEFAKPYDVKGILITHHHFDHIGALKEIESYFHVKETHDIPNFTFEKIKTPGHTKDSVSYYFKEINSIFVGDFIFAGTIGRMDLGGNEKDMKQSLKSFLTKMDNDVIIYPGHGNKTTLKQERTNLEQVMKSL